MPLLANTPFIVTGSGKFFRNVQLDPAANLGVVKVDSDGAGYHILWGLTHEAVPTSELPAHFLSHCERIKATNGKDRVIMHCHATNLIALTYVLENNTPLITRKLWEGSTECLVVFPDGVGILPWMVPGTDEIGGQPPRKCRNTRWYCGRSTACSAAALPRRSIWLDRYRRKIRRSFSQNLFDGRYEADHHA